MSEKSDWLWRTAFEHADHLCNGQCPDWTPGEGVDAIRDPDCFPCQVMAYVEQHDVPPEASNQEETP